MLSCRVGFMTRISVILTALVLLATPLAGCLDEAALEDLIDDVIGCMDENAKNYEDNATTELVGECIYAASMQTFLDSMNQQMGIEELLEQSPSAGYSMSMTMPMDGEDMGLEETIIMNVQETVKVNLSSNSAYVSMHIGIPLMLTSVSTMIQVGEVVNVHNELSCMMVTQMGAETVDDSYQTRDASPNVMEWVLPMLADSMISDDDMMDDEGEDDMMDDLDMMNATMSFTLDPVTNSQTMHLSSTNETGDTLNLTILIDESQNLMSYSMVQSNATSEMHMSYAVMWGDAISITADETLPRTSIPVHWNGLSMSGSDDGDGDEEMFLCDSGEEIPEDWVNDGEEDCYDGSDESEDDDNDPPTPEEAMDDVDANDDGYMNYQEFQDSWESENSELDWDEVATLFDDCDYDGNDLIDIDEMQYFIDGVVDMLIEDGDSDGSPEEWMDYIDADDDGYVSLQEFIDHINNDNDQNGEPPMTSEEEDGFTSVFDNVDSDDDGLLDFDEFIALLESFEDDDDGEMFLCDSGEEIPEDWVNDGEEDCSDGSDESVTVVVDNNNSVEEPRNLSLTVADNQTFEASLNDFAIQFLLCNSDERSECMVEAEASLYSLTGTIGNSSYVYGDLDMDGMISAGDTLEITDMDPNYEFDLYDSWSDSYVSESAVNGPNMPGFGGLLATISMLGAAFLLPRRDD